MTLDRRIRWTAGLVLPLALVVLAWAAQPLRRAASNPSAVTELSGGVSSGIRSLVADVLWLRAYVAWERRDAEAMQLLVRAVAAVDPRPVSFWLNGARMMAYDVPHWRLASLGETGYLPVAVRERIFEEQAQLALRHLAEGRARHASDAALWVEEANIHLNVRRDLEAAVTAYQHAAAQPAAPYYAARVYAELLQRAGRIEDAHAWLVALHPQLDAVTGSIERERAMPEHVLQRIRELEQILGRPDFARYTPLRRDDL